MTSLYTPSSNCKHFILLFHLVMHKQCHLFRDLLSFIHLYQIFIERNNRRIIILSFGTGVRWIRVHSYIFSRGPPFLPLFFADEQKELSDLSEPSCKCFARSLLFRTFLRYFGQRMNKMNEWDIMRTEFNFRLLLERVTMRWRHGLKYSISLYVVKTLA